MGEIDTVQGVNNLPGEWLPGLDRPDLSLLQADQTMRLLANRVSSSALRRRLMSTGWQLLDQATPEATKRILSHPAVGSWARFCGESLSSSAGDYSQDLAYFSAIGAVAAIHSERFTVDTPIAIPAAAGRVVLPTLGQAIFAGHPAEVTLTGRPNGSFVLNDEVNSQTVEIPANFSSAPDWQPLPYLDPKVELNGEDPYLWRNLSDAEPMKKLKPEQVTAWQTRFRQAKEQIAAYSPDQSALMDILRVVVPLKAYSNPLIFYSSWFSRTAGYGTVGVNEPPDSTVFAASLLEEIARGECLALGSHYELHKELTNERSFFSPWEYLPVTFAERIAALYGRRAVMGWWKALLQSPEQQVGLRAKIELAQSYLQFKSQFSDIMRSELLTDEGRRLLEGLGRDLPATSQAANQLPQKIKELAQTFMFDYKISWMLRHIVPDENAMATLANLFRRGGSCEGITSLSYIRPHAKPVQGNAMRRRLFLAAVGVEGPVSWNPEPADEQLISGNPNYAVTGYITQIQNYPHSADPWSGLALSLRNKKPTDPAEKAAARALASHPEVVHAVYLALYCQTNRPPDPLKLAAWLAPLTPPTIMRYV